MTDSRILLLIKTVSKIQSLFSYSSYLFHLDLSFSTARNKRVFSKNFSISIISCLTKYLFVLNFNNNAGIFFSNRLEHYLLFFVYVHLVKPRPPF